MLREFLYTDIERSRSLLAQLSGGVAESDEESAADSTLAGGINTGVFALDASRGQTGRRVSRSLQERVFIDLEARLVEDGYLFDLDLNNEVREADRWASGEVHGTLFDGQIVRFTADISILDPAFFEARVQRFMKFTESIASLNVDGLSKMNPRQRDAAISAQVREYTKGFESSQIDAITEVVKSFTGGELTFRSLACGSGNPEFSFSGLLLARESYIQEEREALLGRFGQSLGPWTSVFQVEAVTQRTDATEHFESDGKGDEEEAAQFNLAEGQVSRVQFENLVHDMIGLFDSVGMTEGPRWPVVSVTPLAIYREVAPAP